MTCQSEVGALHTIFIKHVKDAFINEATIDNEWEALNFTGRPDLEKALAEYAAFEQVLKKDRKSVV